MGIVPSKAHSIKTTWSHICKLILTSLLFQVANRAKMHGIGRHSSDEIHKIGCDDIRAISTYLGTKPYLMGESPTVVSSFKTSLTFKCLIEHLLADFSYSRPLDTYL